MGSSPIDTPLTVIAFRALRGLDVDRARHVVAEAFCPHRLTALDKAHRFETRFHSVGTGDVSLSYLDYGGRVDIAPYEQKSFYLVLIPLAGKAELSHGREQALYDSNGASVPPVDREYPHPRERGQPASGGVDRPEPPRRAPALDAGAPGGRARPVRPRDGHDAPLSSRGAKW